jgi:AcrR family transcriptional regulator
VDFSPLVKDRCYTPAVTHAACPSLTELSGALRERADAAANRQHILAAARRLFEQYGVEQVSMDEIARAAGVGKGTLYRRYPDKAMLVIELMDACFLQFERETLDAIAAGSGCTSAVDQLDAFLDRLIGWTEEHTAWLGVIADQSGASRRGAGRCGPIYRWLHGVVDYLLRQAVAAGEASIDDTVYAADVILSAVDVDLYVFQRRERNYAPEQIRAGLHELVERLREHSRVTR